MQTWEYAPQYALRTYAYLVPMAGIAKVYEYILSTSIFCSSDYCNKILTSSLLLVGGSSSSSTVVAAAAVASSTITIINKPLLFALLRSTLSLFTCLSEIIYLHAIYDVAGPTVAYWTAFTSLSCTGMFHSYSAYLPSATVATIWRISASYQLRKHYTIAITWGLVATFAVGWPFCAVLFIPTGLLATWHVAYQHRVGTRHGRTSDVGAYARLQSGYVRDLGDIQMAPIIHLLVRSVLYHAALITIGVAIIDYQYYGQQRIVFPNWNIFTYNAKSGGDELYGIEPLSYYIRNLLLNFNYTAILGIVSLPLLLMIRIVARRPLRRRGGLDVAWVLLPMYLWMGIVFPRPHKEERFLFPIYPMLCLGVAVTLRELMYLFTSHVYTSWPNNSPLKKTKTTQGDDVVEQSNKNDGRGYLLLGLALLLPSAIISTSRSMALYHNYAAPLAVYRDLFYHASSVPVQTNNNADAQQQQQQMKTSYICTAGEWHRYPSSFFLPPNYQLGYLKSSFNGQLPQPFTKFGSKQTSLDIQSGLFNNVNGEEMDRYVDISVCSYIVELVPFGVSDNSSSSSSNDRQGDEVVAPECLQYMETDTSGGSWRLLISREYLDVKNTSLIHRILYIPWSRRSDQITYNRYNVYAKEM